MTIKNKKPASEFSLFRSCSVSNRSSSKISGLSNRFALLTPSITMIGALLLGFIPSIMQADISRDVIIKADDFRGQTMAWDKFLSLSRSAGVKVSIGVIAESIEGKPETAKWMKEQEAKGDVEFWNHGLDHKKWNVADKSVSEFGGSGLVHQREHLVKSQSILREALGRNMTTLGTPFNAFDADTSTVIKKHPELRLFFSHNVPSTAASLGKTVMVVRIIGETDGVGKPNAAGLALAWEKLKTNPAPVSLQLHPPVFEATHWIEYEKILSYIKAQGSTFRLPSELIKPL